MKWIIRIVIISLFITLAGIITIFSLTAKLVGEKSYQPPIARNPVPNLVQPQPRDSLLVMTLNIAHGRADGVNQILQSRPSIEANLKEIASVFLREEPSIVALQEADGPSIWSGNFNHVQLLAEETQFPYYVHGEHVKSSWLSYGTAILSKLPVLETLSFTFQPTPPTPAKGFILATVEWPDESGRVVDLVSVHLDFSLREIREKQAGEIIQTLSTRENPLIMLGDFNSEWNEEGSIVRLVAEALDLKVYDPKSNGYITYISSDYRIDWILISNELEFKTFDVLSDRVSDHSAVISEIVFSENK